LVQQALPLAKLNVQNQPATGLGAVAAAASTALTAATPATTTAAAPGSPVPATPDGLAAAITAMQQSGQTSAVLQLDPAGLGALSVHVALGHNAQINVQFVPAVAQTAQLLSNGMEGLRQAMTASGLTLGQVQVGGGQTNGGGGGQGRQSPPSPGGTRPTPTTETGPGGIRAYA